MASTARIDELKKKFDENPRRYFAPLANEFRKLGDIEQAIIICEEFLPQQPGHMSGHIVYGQALFEAGRLRESRTVFETALALDPENLIALRHLGDIAHGEDDMAGARSWYLRVLDADPRNEEIQSLIAALGDATTAEPPQQAAAEVMPELDMAPDLVPDVAPDLSPDLSPELSSPPIEFDVSMDDTQPLGMPVIPPAPVVSASAPPAAADDDLLDGFSTHGFETTPETSSLMPSTGEPALGLESTAFMPPDEPVEELMDLDASLDSGVPSFSAPVAPVAALDGLQGSGGIAHEELAAAHADLPSLDLDDGLVLPPQGDPVAPHVHAPPPVSHASSDELLDLDMDFGPSAALPAPEPVASVAPPSFESSAPVMSELALDTSDGVTFDAGDELAESFDMPPAEVPPEVIAAEADLMEERETLSTVVEEPFEREMVSPAVDEEFEMPVAETAPVSAPPFVTETMAELYVAQGFREQAASVYSQLSAASPHDERLRNLADSLSQPAPVADPGPSVRDFLSRIAARRPGSRMTATEPPASDDFAPLPDSDTEVPEEAPYSVMAAEEAAAPEAAVNAAETTAPETGTIDAFFGNRSAATSEDSAAAALAQAFGGAPDDVSMISGRPAHAATGELSLDSVFRDGGTRAPRSSSSFSFDQFFSSSSTSPSDRQSGAVQKRTSAEIGLPDAGAAERGTEDIEQFNSWLQGLKPR
ncbi:MAG: tetratricopeptide repeat protein [Gemmatimonadota bacterium]